MKRIDKKDYNKSMGILIDLEDTITIHNYNNRMNHPAAEQTGYHKVLQHQV